MCGRFALGVNSTELREQLARQYFGASEGEGPEAQPEEEEDSSGPQSEEPSTAHQDGRYSPSRERSHVSENEIASEQGEEVVISRENRVSWCGSENEATWRPRYNVAPKSGGVVVRRSKSGQYELSVLRWGLVPHWTKTPQEDPPSTINAMMESVFEGRPTWRVRDSKRCIVVAQGFYEWKTNGKEKIPHFIKRADGKLMIFAGLWDYCDYKGNYDPVTSYTIITTPVNKQLQQIHSRMPAILESASDIETWLSSRKFDDAVRAVIKPFRGHLDLYPVDQGVGKVGNDSEDFIKPVAQKAGSLDSLFAKQARVVMNPDEDTKVKSEQFGRLAKEEEEEKAKYESKVERKKREVETLELPSSDEEERAGNDDKPSGRGMKKKLKPAAKEDSTLSPPATKGNAKLERFFPVIDR